ncbi:MAG TPA: hypothetical protein VGG56_09535 [Terracidiphilus sp.]
MKSARAVLWLCPILLASLLAYPAAGAQSAAGQQQNGSSPAPVQGAHSPAQPDKAATDSSAVLKTKKKTDKQNRYLPQGSQSSSANVVTSSPLKITLTPSELPLKLGSNSNIAADIQNISNQPVEIETTSIQLMAHSILTPSGSLCSIPLPATANSQIMQDRYLVLEPQDHFSVFFNLSQRSMTDQQRAKLLADSQAQPAAAPIQVGGQSAPSTQLTRYQQDLQDDYLQSCQTTVAGRIKRAIDFTPGNYDYYVSGRFSVCHMVGEQISCYDPTRPFGQNATFQVGIDQSLIIIFSIVGGMLAYLVVTVRSADGPINDFFTLLASESGFRGIGHAFSKDGVVLLLKILRDSIGVAILSSAFTVVTSRLSDSQFPVKVSVLDVWGAITIGFLSYFAGNKFIDSLRNTIK